MKPKLGDPELIAVEQRHRLAAGYGLAERYGLSVDELAKLLEDVWLLTEDTPEVYAKRRHAELQALGIPNARIFAMLERELAEGRFAAGPRSVRQIRRMIYG